MLLLIGVTIELACLLTILRPIWSWTFRSRTFNTLLMVAVLSLTRHSYFGIFILDMVTRAAYVAAIWWVLLACLVFFVSLCTKLCQFAIDAFLCVCLRRRMLSCIKNAEIPWSQHLDDLVARGLRKLFYIVCL